MLSTHSFVTLKSHIDSSIEIPIALLETDKSEVDIYQFSLGNPLETVQ